MESSIRVILNVLIVIMAGTLFLYGYIGFNSFDVEARLYGAAKHGRLADIFLLGAIVGPLTISIILIALSNIKTEIQLRKLHLLGNAVDFQQVDTKFS